MQTANLYDMYAKPIDRPIDSVIKASSDEHLANELDEYIFTPDIVSRLEGFYDEYNDPDATGNGAWISGFFGSGKSHLLKILALALEDREVDGTPALDRLLPKLDDEPYLKGQMEVARERHPSESVLFNVDVEADNTGKGSAGAMLSAFIQAFNRHCGYYTGSRQFIAEMEYDLDCAGRLDAFKRGVLARVDKPWEEIRDFALVYATKISAAYDEACGNEPDTNQNILKLYEDSYKPSISSFAARVKRYIDARGKGFRLNFFVDEVGQFIAQDDERMLNLQSIAEELNTACNGNSWVIVTSQEDVETLTGHMSESSANDFSKIQGRFKVRMSLKSEDAEDIIKRRLLAKTEEARPPIGQLYEERSGDFDYLFDFSGGRRYSLYEGEDDFVDTYPFVPYQFRLFIQVMRTLSDHGALQGQQKSTGARSMLGVFQEVAIELGRDHPEDLSRQGPMAAFDAMFEGLRGDIKSEFYAQVSQAERNLGSNPLAIRVLKALLLVKYCDDFSATPANLRILLLGSLSENTSSLESSIKDALTTLEDQAYVRRNADRGVYEYLTNEEKDVENEILNIKLSSKEQEECIKDLCGDVFGPLKVDYVDGKFSAYYQFNLKVDGDPLGPQRCDLSVDILTESADEGGGLMPRLPSAPRTLSVQLRDDEAFLNELVVYLKTKKYVNVNGGEGSRKGIIDARRSENGKRYEKLKEGFAELLGGAMYCVAGNDVSGRIAGTGAEALKCGMRELVKRTYTYLPQLRNVRLGESAVYDSCFDRQMTTETGLPEYVRTVLYRTRMASSNAGAAGVTMGGSDKASLIKSFERGEYGWPEIAVRQAVAVLVGKGFVEVLQAGKPLEGADIALKLKAGKAQDMEKLELRVVEEIDSGTLSRIRSAYRAIVGQNPEGDDAKSIANNLKEHLAAELSSLESIRGQVEDYPFKQRFEDERGALDEARESLENDWRWISLGFLEELDDLKASVGELQKMRSFVKGPLATRYKDLRDFCEHDLAEARELQLSELEDQAALGQMCSLVKDEECYKSSEWPTVKKKLSAIKDEMEEKKGQLRATAARELADYRRSFEEDEDFAALGEDAQARFGDIFDAGELELEDCGAAHQLKSFMSDFKDRHGDEILRVTTPAARPQPAVSPSGVEPAATLARPQTAPAVSAAPATVQLSSIKAKAYARPTIKSASDVDAYLAALRAALLAELESGHIIMK